MFILANLIKAVAQILDIVLNITFWLIIIRALISWVNPDPFNPIVQFLHRITEPILMPIRRIFPLGTIDISPIIACLVIYFIRAFLIASLFDISAALR